MTGSVLLTWGFFASQQVVIIWVAYYLEVSRIGKAKAA